MNRLGVNWFETRSVSSSRKSEIFVRAQGTRLVPRRLRCEEFTKRARERRASGVPERCLSKKGRTHRSSRSNLSVSSTVVCQENESTEETRRVPRGLTPRVKSTLRRVLFARCTVQSSPLRLFQPFRCSTTAPRIHHPTGTPPRTTRAVPTSLVP